MNEAYLDFASTTPVHPDALAEMGRVAAMVWADPSRLYGAARSARMVLDSARASIAHTISAQAEEVIFTASGSESCNLAVRAGAKAAAAARKPRRILVSAIEHTAVLEAARSLDGFDVVEIPVEKTGLVNLDVLRQACKQGAGLVSIQHANQEIGTMQVISEASAITREAGALLHTDACMTLGHIPVSVKELAVDLLSASSHKSYGPKGAGLLWSKRSVRVRPDIVGDDRERRRRAGMENLPAIAGFAAALSKRAQEAPEEQDRLFAWSNRIRTELPNLIEGVEFHGHPTERVPGLCSFTVERIDAEAMLLLLDQQGVFVHSGSSCSASATEPSHVLAAIGASATGSLRISLGRVTTEDHVDHLLQVLPVVVEKLRRFTAAQ